MKATITSLAAVFGSLVYAQSSTVSLFLLDTDPQSLVASVVEASPSSTVYVLNCPDGTDSTDCGTFDEWVTHGKDFYAMNQTQGDFSATWSCDVAGTTSASCSESFGGSEANFPGTTETQLSGSDITYFPVIITAGAEKLTGGSATATAAPASNSASSTGAPATTTTAAILFPEVDPKQLAASVVTAGPSTTIYQIDCATGPNKNDSCPFGSQDGGIELRPWVTMGGNTFFGANYSQQIQDVTFSCSVSSTSFASCVERLTEAVNGPPSSSTITTNLALSYGQVTVTAGVEKLASATSGSASSSGSSGAAPRETGGLGMLAVAAVAGVGMLV